MPTDPKHLFFVKAVMLLQHSRNTSTRMGVCVVVGGVRKYGSTLEWGIQQLKAHRESTDLWNVCVVSANILNNEDLFIHMLNDTH